MGTLPRERFVPDRFRALAYSDEGIEVFPAIDGASNPVRRTTA